MLKEKTSNSLIVEDPILVLRISVKVHGQFFRTALPRVADFLSVRLLEELRYHESTYLKGYVPSDKLRLPWMPDELRRTSLEQSFVDKSVEIELLPPGSQKSVLDLLR